MNILIETAFVQLIREALELPTASVWIRNQNRVIPNDKGLYVVVGRAAGRPFGTSREVIETGSTMKEIVRVQVRESVTIDILSQSDDALNRQWEILAALKSIRAQRIQEDNYFKIGTIPTGFVNTSAAEGGSMLNRFTLVVECLAWYRKEKLLTDYYDDFETRIDDEASIGGPDGIIEFDINANDTPYPPEGFALIVNDAGEFVTDSSGRYVIYRKV